MSNRIKFFSDYVSKQISIYFPDDFVTTDVIAASLPSALRRTDFCIGNIKAWRNNDFNYLISGQYAIFLYYLSSCIWTESGSCEVATRVFLLNKALNGIDIFYEVSMPDIFLIGHTVGMVFSKAYYDDFFVMHQSCTIGRNGSDRPTLEKGVILYPNSSVIGKCLVRSNSVISPGVQLVNQDTPGNCYVFMGEKGKPVFKEIDEFFADRYFERGIKQIAVKNDMDRNR